MALGAQQKHLLYTEVSKLIEAGFGMKDAILTLLEQDPPKDQADLLRSVQEGLNRGEDITSSFAQASGDVTKLERNIIEAGERGGKVGTAFEHLGDFFGMVARNRKQALISMIYPAILLHLGVFVAVVPKALIQNQGTLNDLGSIAADLLIAFAFLYAAVLVIWLVTRTLMKRAPHNPSVDRFLGAIPIFGKMRRNMAMARFTKVYHICLVAGMSMSETAQMAAEAAQSGQLQSAGDALVRTARTGDRLGPVFVRERIFPRAFARSYTSAEESGSLDRDLSRWAGVYQDDAEQGAKHLAVALPKVMYVLIMLFVAWQIISFYMVYMGRIGELMGR